MKISAMYQTNYNKKDCLPGIVHVGFGGFHRAHQAVYVDDYMQATGELHWGIIAVNLRAEDRQRFEKTRPEKTQSTQSEITQHHTNDGYMLKTMSPNDTHSWRKVRAHIDAVDWSQDPNQAEQLLGMDTIELVTITITESGYMLDEDGGLDDQHSVIRDELVGGKSLSIYAYLRNALAFRAQSCATPVTIACCDNMRGNGEMLERNFQKYLELLGATELAQWVSSNVTFPCSMVDRITPRTTNKLEEEASRLFPDCRVPPVHAETYIQWVLEDKFAGKRPDLDTVGVEIVDDVQPYEEAKIRILNGGHTGLSYLAALSGFDTFDQAMRDPVCRSHFEQLEAQEILPAIDFALPFDKHGYSQQVTDRFSNRSIEDTLERICMDGYAKFPLFFVPTVKGCLQQGISPEHSYTTIASWYVFARRSAQGRLPFPYHEPNWDSLAPLIAENAEYDFAQEPKLWGSLPQTYPDFPKKIVQSIQEVEEKWPM